jgi:signal peptidase I
VATDCVQLTAQPRVPTRVLRGIGSVLIAVFLVVAALLVVVAVLARSDARGVTRVQGHPVLTVLSGSMTPTFRPGDLVIDAPVTASTASRLAVGDVITFRLSHSGALVTHRIIRVLTTPNGSVTYQTQGDANNIADSDPIAPSQVVGTYSKRIPYAGYALRAAKSRGGLFLLVLVPLVAFVATEIAKRWGTSSSSDHESPEATFEAPTPETAGT